VVALLGVGLSGGRALAEKPKEAKRRWLDLPVFRQRDTARDLTPSAMDLTPEAAAAPGAARAIRVRVYADRDYRELVLRWRLKARTQIDRINSVVQPVFGVRFEIESLREWDRSHVGQPLGSVLDEIEALDPAEEVDWVIGLATPLHGVATSVHQIGIAHVLARHFVLRGMDDEQEALAIERDLKLLSPEERTRLYAERKGHKEIVMFLHEWGHTLGLLHNEDRAVFMNPAYDNRQKAFSDFERSVMSLALARRLERRGELYPETADLLPLFESAPRDEGSDQERAELLDFARKRARGGGRHVAGGGGGVGSDLSAADIEAYNRAVEAANAGRLEEAWKGLSPVIQRAAERGKKVGGDTWLRLADLAAAAGALTAADQAAAHAGEHDPGVLKLGAQIESTRHRIALPLDSASRGVPPEREPAYVAGFRAVADVIATAPIAEARARLRGFADAFPGAPGADVLGCDLELKARRVAEATKSCEAALDKFKGATRALYLLGEIAAATHKPAAAERHMRQAIAMDPSDANPWRALAHLFRETRDRRRLAALAEEHQALLSTPLPD
jgi:tetratricopeptide (TPR) repeat protein